MVRSRFIFQFILVSMFYWKLRGRASTEMQGTSFANSRVWIATADMQGWRLNMEDRHEAIYDWPSSNGEQTIDAYLALFDGHGGPKAAYYAFNNFSEILQRQEAYSRQEYPVALKQALAQLDREICSDQFIYSGSTALVALVVDSSFHIAHVGDSRAVICTAGHAKDLTQAHTTSLPEERERILKAGGFVRDHRVCGNLAMTRSLGDSKFKKNKNLPPEEQIITALPDVVTQQVKHDDEFLVLATDGIWDCFSSQEVVDIIRYQVASGATITQACAFLCETCLAPPTYDAPGTDNMTLVVVAFLHGRTEKEWMEWIKTRVNSETGRATPSSISQIYGEDKPLAHPANVVTDFNFALLPIVEPLWDS